MINRRSFLEQAGLISAGVILAPGLLQAKPIKTPGLQLYSLREQLPADVNGVIAKVAVAGYKEVETFSYNKTKGFWGLDAKAFNALLKNNGLTTCGGHYDMNTFFRTGTTEELETYIEAANITGQTYVVVPSINAALIKTVDDFKATADKLNKAAEVCKKAGLKLGYHNHNFEWKPVDGTTFYDTIINNTDPALVSMEMDIYWVVRSGKDPIELMEKHPGRYAMVHIKDMDKTTPNLNTEIGKGSIDYKAIMKKAKLGGVSHFIMEQENYINIDPYVSIKESCDYMKTLDVA